MNTLGFYFNQDNCTGCRTCQVACKDKNGLKVGILFRKVRTYETGSYPTPGLYHYSGSCNNCVEAPCVKICPTGAMHYSQDGTVDHDDKKCISCGNCVENCPYEAPQYLDINGQVGKCDSCRDLREKGLNPVCVDACTMRVLEFGDIDKLKEIHEGEHLVDSLPCFPISDARPSVLIKPRKCALIESFVEKKEI